MKILFTPLSACTIVPYVPRKCVSNRKVGMGRKYMRDRTHTVILAVNLCDMLVCSTSNLGLALEHCLPPSLFLQMGKICPLPETWHEIDMSTAADEHD